MLHEMLTVVEAVSPSFTPRTMQIFLLVLSAAVFFISLALTITVAVHFRRELFRGGVDVTVVLGPGFFALSALLIHLASGGPEAMFCFESNCGT